MCERGKAETEVLAGAPEHAIEVTPEMIEEGAKIILREFDYLSEMHPSWARSIANDIVLACFEGVNCKN